MKLIKFYPIYRTVKPSSTSRTSQNNHDDVNQIDYFNFYELIIIIKKHTPKENPSILIANNVKSTQDIHTCN